MTFRAALGAIALVAPMFCAWATEAASPSAKSSGISVTIFKTLVEQKKIILQFTATNATTSRVYLRNAQYEASEKALLGSGEQLGNYPSAAGIEQCSTDVTGCVSNNYHGDDLNTYSYIEPGESLSFGFTYEASSPVSDDDTISFSVALIARFASPNGDPDKAGPMKVIRLNFPYTPLTHH